MGRVVINDSSDNELFTASNPGAVSGTVAVTGTQSDALTDTELRASAVPVSGPLTDAELRSTDVAVTLDGETVPITHAAPTAIYAGQTVVAASGTEVPLTTTQALKSGVTVKALATNTNNVAVGPNPVTMTTGLLLAAGEWAFIEVDDLAKVYIDATTNGEGVSWVGS